MSKQKDIQQRLEDLQEPLPKENIDFRVDDTFYHKDSQTAFAALLAYKDARVDMSRLDNIIGIGNWQNKYKRDSNGVLQCGIGINVNDEWIWKWSNGTPSNFEREKGEYSDALKRAGFVWGIGRELYKLPRLRVMLHESEHYKQMEDDEVKIGIRYSFKPSDWYWKIDWEHEGKHGDKGLIWAKETPNDSKYRVKPKSIFLGINHKT